MRKSILFCWLLMMISLLSAQHIQEITGLNPDHVVVDYDCYSGTLNRYQDRLYANNSYKVEEYQILPNNELIRISYYQKSDNFSRGSIISDGYLYVIDQKTGVPQILIFNIQVSPMVFETAINSPMAPYYNDANIAAYQNYLLISERNLGLTLKFDTQTRQFVDNLMDLEKPFVVSDSVLISCRKIENTDQTSFVLSFYNLNNCSTNSYGELINEVVIDDDSNCSEILKMKTEGDLLYLMGYAYFRVMNIEDIMNPQTICCKSDIPFEPNSHYEYTDLLLHDYALFTVDYSMKLKVFDIRDSSWSTTLYEDDAISWCQAGTLLLNYPVLYRSNGKTLNMYNVENSVNLINRYGIYRDDVVQNYNHVAYYNRKTALITICDLFSEQPDTYLFKEHLDELYQIILKDQKLFLNYTYLNQPYIEYYDTSVYPYQLIDTVEGFYYNIKLIGEYLYASRNENTLNINYVWHIEDNSLEYITQFNGNIQNTSGYDDPTCFVNANHNLVEFRNVSNPGEILFSHVFSGINEYGIIYPYLINQETAFYVNFSGNSTFHHFDSEGIYQTSSVFNFPNLCVYNEILSYSASDSDLMKTFYVGDGLLTQLGSFNMPIKGQARFYPEFNKMVYNAGGEISVFNFEYCLSKDETPTLTHKVSVYPNPSVNSPLTFKMQEKINKGTLSIYNIKGQLIKTDLVNNIDEYVWDKKNSQKQTVSSGIYFYRINAGKTQYNGKLMILK